ncbi:hypothetical protein CS022_08070 [Veronia nyctiphanis]|uniref:HTH cro/C1-type domain-containing protein n=1 Tax=Veronia nyctiphanis TaxID=1278244 RepID=A0A4Q0YR85_9GAMM|nr:helix-turn-helix transcriptional regulator [Veronia nyctiphanis]RXJ73687.1 hypothetical protein CS022_08070 [Veronia nyctiphanis]
MGHSQATRMLETLKSVLKSKGLTYKELAERCDMTEVTIKRLLNRPHIALDQLIQLCEAADTSMNDILWMMENDISKYTSEMSREQLKAQLEKPALMEVFIAIVAGSRRIQSLSDKFGINLPSAYIYARELEKLNFITLSGENIELVYPLSANTDFDDSPEFSSMLFNARLEAIKRQASSKEKAFGNISFGTVILTDAEFNAYKERFTVLQDEIAQITLKHIRKPSDMTRIYQNTHATFESTEPLFPVENLVDEV